MVFRWRIALSTPINKRRQKPPDDGHDAEGGLFAHGAVIFTRLVYSLSALAPASERSCRLLASLNNQP